VQGGSSPSTSPVGPDALGRSWRMAAVGRFEAFVEELAQASATSDARHTQQRRERLAVKYRLGYPADLVPALKAKYGLKLIGEQQPSGWLEGARLELRGHGARAWRAAPAREGRA
jgi:hypothetical protein